MKWKASLRQAIEAMRREEGRLARELAELRARIAAIAGVAGATNPKRARRALSAKGRGEPPARSGYASARGLNGRMLRLAPVAAPERGADGRHGFVAFELLSNGSAPPGGVAVGATRASGRREAGQSAGGAEGKGARPCSQPRALPSGTEHAMHCARVCVSSQRGHVRSLETSRRNAIRCATRFKSSVSGADTARVLAFASPALDTPAVTRVRAPVPRSSWTRRVEEARVRGVVAASAFTSRIRLAASRATLLLFAGLLASAPGAALTTEQIASDTAMNALIQDHVFTAEGRIGNRALNGTFELDLGKLTEPTPRAALLMPREL